MPYYGGSGRRERSQSRHNLNAEAWCSTHQRYYRTHMKMGCRVVLTGGCPQCGTSGHRTESMMDVYDLSLPIVQPSVKG